MNAIPVKVTCLLASPLCGEAPYLDALLEFSSARHARAYEESRSDRHGGYSQWREKIQPGGSKCGTPSALTRAMPAPRAGALPISIVRRDVCGVPVPLCSSPIIAECEEQVEYIHSSVRAGELADIVGAGPRNIARGEGKTKSYRVPLRVLPVRQIVWFCMAYGAKKGSRADGSPRHRNPLAQMRMNLRDVYAVGQRRDIGYGRVAQWIVEEAPADYSWFAPCDGGQMLMRPLPAGAEIPADLRGYRRCFGAACAPYWHPERYIQIIMPC